MALARKSIDEEVAALADVYDSLIAPKKILRNHNNRVYLILRAYAAGKVGLNDAALTLRHRFDPLYCEDVDLYSTAKLVGTDFKKGTGSLLNITIVNKSAQETITLPVGIYNYQSASGMVFYFEIANDIVFDPEESRQVTAISREKGSFTVFKNADIKMFRSDDLAINRAFVFSCDDNASQLGYIDESVLDFRLRILNDANRQDHIKELELKIRNLPNIFECNLVMNEAINPQEYDGIMLGPKELLVTITGVPTNEIAKLVAEEVLYATHMVDPDKVVYYEHELYLNGRYPVYYRFHDTTDFSMAVCYQYDRGKLKSSQIEDAIKQLFKPYTSMVTHLDTFGEEDAYKVLSNLNLPNVKILDANILDSEGAEVPYIRIPRTKLPHLTGIAFTAIEVDIV